MQKSAEPLSPASKENFDSAQLLALLWSKEPLSQNQQLLIKLFKTLSDLTSEKNYLSENEKDQNYKIVEPIRSQQDLDEAVQLVQASRDFFESTGVSLNLLLAEILTRTNNGEDLPA